MRTGSLLGLAAFALPAAAAVALVVRFGVDVPNWDEWLFVPFLERVGHGQATLGDWLAPHNEHVVLVPRVLLAALAFTFGWNIWFGLAAGLFFAAGTAGALRRLCRPAGGNGSLLLAGDFATALLVFSLVQYENWLWGMQSAWFLANLCVVLALVALRPTEKPTTPRRIALAAVACFVATLTTAQGPFAWLALLPLVAAGGGRARERVAAWLGLTLVVGGVLFLCLRSARHAPTAEAALGDPLGVARFFLALLGAPLAPQPGAAAVLGALLCVSLLVLGALGLRAPDRPSALPWCCLGAFGLMVAAATALARVGFGVDYALSSRYTTNAVLVWVAAWHLARLRLAALPAQAARAATLGLLAALSFGLYATGRWAVDSANLAYLSLSGGKACLELGDLLEPTRLNEGPMIYVFMHPAGARRRLETLLALGVRQPRPRPAFDRAEDGRLGMVTPTAHAGASSPASGGTVTGWTAVENREHPPLLLLSANEGRSFVAAQLLAEGVSPLGARVRFRTPSVAEWEIPLEANGPSPPPGPISAWRFDPGPNRIARLAGSAP